MAALKMYTPQTTNDDLLIQQLQEWAQIEDDYDAIPWTITDPGDEEYNFDKLDEAVQRHIAHARAGPPSSTGKEDISDMYLTRCGLDCEGMPLNHGVGSAIWAWEHWDPSTIDWPETHLLDTYGGHFACFPSDFNLERRPTRLNEDSEGIEDNEGRIILRGIVTNKGMNYMKASTPCGDCYINLKFTRYVPDIGSPIRMVCRFQDPTMNIPLKCVKVV